ncbi:MAG: ATP-binding protein [Armatimonadota bacterium]|nr:MAG: ATP-binding protein [Armatimonadota bacterium]
MRDLCQHIMDLVENAAAARASRVSVELCEDETRDRMTLSVEDNGRGIGPDALERAADPFYTTRQTRAVGLGLSLLRAAAARCGGDFAIHSTPGQGTRVECSFGLSHIDRAPLGDVVATLTALVAVHPGLDLRYEHRQGDRCFSLDTAEFRAALGEGPGLDEPAVVAALRRYLAGEWDAFRERAGPSVEERAPPAAARDGAE